jgi:osmotically-inducible protein OsmY
MDDRDRRWRDRDWRRSEDVDRDGGFAGEGYYPRGGAEERSFGGAEQEFGARRSGPERDRVFGEQETGASYNRPQPGGGGYGAGSYGGGESYGRGAGGGPDRNYSGGRHHGHGQDWQGRNYGGVSPAMAHHEYDLDREHGQGGAVGGGRGAMRFQNQDYTQGGRFYGDDDRQRIYREEYGQGGREYGRVPGGYDAGGGRGQGRGQGPTGGSYGGSYGGAGGDYGYQPRPAYGGQASGGTGGYDFERGYGDAGRRDLRSGGGAEWSRGPHEGHEGGGAQDFLQKAGQKVRNWIKGDHLMEGSGGEERGYRSDFGRERRYFEADRGHRGAGPKGYKRSDERISEEVHERLTDDSWLDASGINVKVSNGEVNLTGTVENREAKHRAERIVEDISGVTHVDNDLRVMPANPLTGSGRGFGDSAMEAQMRKDDPAANGSGGAAGSTPGNGSEDSASTRTTTRRT